MIFNERVCTKTGKNTTTNNSDKSESMYADVGDIPESLTIESPQIEESIESCNTQLSNISEHPTPKHVLRRSSWPCVSNKRYIGEEFGDYAEAS